MKLQTAVWYPAKEKLIGGPSFAKSLQILYEHKICTFSMNRSHVIIMGDFFKNNVEENRCNSCNNYKVAVINFQLQEWFHLKDIYLDFYTRICRGALGFEKNGKRLVIHSNNQNFYFTKLWFRV